MKKKKGQSNLPPWLVKKAGGKGDSKGTSVTCPKCGNVFVPKS